MPASSAPADVRVERQDGRVKQVAVGAEPRPLYEVLREAAVEPFDFDLLEVVSDGVSSGVELTRAEAFARDDPALITDTEDRARLEYEGDTVASGVLTLRLADAAPLEVTATATPARVEVGERVAFEAVVAGVADGERADVNWTFGDETPRGHGLRVSHIFSRAATYNVLVGATTAGDPSGDSAIVSVVVGQPPRATPTATPAFSPVPGVVGSGGGPASPASPDQAGSAVAPEKSPRATPTAHVTATPTAAAPFGPTVEGRLLGGGLVASAPAPPAPADEPPVRDDTAGLRLPPEAVAAGVLALLAVVGFTIDMRRARARWA